MRRILITGGMGFIGSTLIERLLSRHPDVEVVNFDALTYAANKHSLDHLNGNPRYRFIQGDIRYAKPVVEAIEGCWGVVHLAAETHVDRSLIYGGHFVTTNVLGTYNVLAAARDAGVKRVLVQSTDEVYGPTPEGVEVDEQAPLAPRSPYSASKLGAEMQGQVFFTSYGLPVVIARPMNTIGPRQHPEKMVPLFTTLAMMQSAPLPLYGDGSQERDRFHVDDHAAALDLLLHEGMAGEVYNAGAGNYATNRWVAERILDLLGEPHDRIQTVTDRPGHDARYRLDTSKLQALGWRPEVGLDDAIERTVRWYQHHQEWWWPLYVDMRNHWYRRQYRERLKVTA